MDWSSFWSLVVLAATAAASPFSLVTMGIVLASARGRKNGVAFILGWITTVMLLGVAAALVGEAVDINESNTAGKWTLALELALGVLLILLWLRRRVRPRIKAAAEAKPAKPEPAWQKRIDTMKVVGAFVLGGATQTWPVMIAAGAEISRLQLGTAAALAWMFAFALATTIGIVVLEVLEVRTPGSGKDRLDRMRNYFDTHRDAVVNALFLLGGLWLLVRALMGLIG